MCLCLLVGNNLVPVIGVSFWGGFAHFSLWRRYLCGRPRAASVIFRGRDNTKRSTEGRSLDRGLPGGKDTRLGERHGTEGRRSGIVLSGSTMSRPPRVRQIRKRKDFFALSLLCLLSAQKQFV